MKMTTKRTTIIGISLGLIVLLVGSSALYAHFGPPWGRGGCNPEEHADWVRYRLTKQLDLDASQQQELEAITQELIKKAKALHEMRTTGRQEVLSILRAESMDEQRIENLVTQHREEINGLITTASTQLTAFLNMLTPEQRERLAKLIEDHAGCGRFH